MNGRTKCTIDMFASVACLTLFATSVQSDPTTFQNCNLAKCFFGTQYEKINELTENYAYKIDFPPQICSQTVTNLVLAAQLPKSCGSDYSSMRQALGKYCKTDLTSRSASCGNVPDDVTGYLITYVIFYGVLVFFNFSPTSQDY